MCEGYCSVCSQTVTLLDYEMDPELAQAEEDYFNCVEHTRSDGLRCAGSGQSPRQLIKPEADDGNYLTLADLDPEDHPEQWEEDWD